MMSRTLKIDIPFHIPFKTEKSWKYLEKVFRSNHLCSSGPLTEKCQRWLNESFNSQKSLLTHSCTAALEMAALLIDLKPGDEVIMPANTFIATAWGATLVGATPVFVDCEADSYNIDPAKVEAAITDKTKAIVAVHLYGQPADMDPLRDIAKKHNLFLVEDAAQAHLAEYKGKRVGALSDICSFSFYPGKNLGAYGEGGAVFTDDDQLAERMKEIRVHGQKRKHEHTCIGLNGRFDTMQAAILLEKLKLFPDECKQRTLIAKRYDEAFSKCDSLTTPIIADYNQSVYAQYTILLDNPDALQLTLQENNIPAVAYYKVPMHLQPVFNYLNYSKGAFPITEAVAARCLSLPMSPYLSQTDQDRVIQAIIGAM